MPITGTFACGMQVNPVIDADNTTGTGVGPVQKVEFLKCIPMSNYLAELYFMEATELLIDWKYAEAKKKLEEIVELEPGYGRAHFRLGWLYFFRLCDFERANYHLRLAMKLSPEFTLSYY